MIRCILLVIATLITTPAVAHNNPENWIGQEHRLNALGQLCCGKNDCHAFTVDEVTVMPDGYHFPGWRNHKVRQCRTLDRSFVLEVRVGRSEGNKVRLCPAKAIMIERETALRLSIAAWTSGRPARAVYRPPASQKIP